MPVLERYSSPDDGTLVLIVDGDDGDVSVGFQGFEWHAHGDLLVGWYGSTQAEAVATFVKEILSVRLVIAVCSRNGVVNDVCVTDDAAAEPWYATADEQILLRFWSGRTWQAEL